MNTFDHPMTTARGLTEGSGSPATFRARREAFRRMHDAGCFVVPNPWHVGSARYAWTGFTRAAQLLKSEGSFAGLADVLAYADISELFATDYRSRRTAGLRGSAF